MFTAKICLYEKLYHKVRLKTSDLDDLTKYKIFCSNSKLLFIFGILWYNIFRSCGVIKLFRW